MTREGIVGDINGAVNLSFDFDFEICHIYFITKFESIVFNASNRHGPALQYKFIDLIIENLKITPCRAMNKIFVLLKMIFQ